jgi:uncharacterized protein with GYD domain
LKGQVYLLNYGEISWIFDYIPCDISFELSQYYFFRNYDFLNILEAPDNETVLKVMVELGARGTLETVTMPAMPVEEFLRALK